MYRTKRKKREIIFFLVLLVINVGIFSYRIRSSAEEEGPSLRTIDRGEDCIWIDDSFGYRLAEADGAFFRINVLESEGYGVVVRGPENEYRYANIQKGKHDISLCDGDGEYTILFAKHLEGSTYRINETVTVTVRQDDSIDVFLRPSYFVDYDEDSPFLKQKAEELQGSTVRETVQAVTDYVYRNIRYDRAKAEEIRKKDIRISQAIPDIEKIFQEGKGICLDQAAVTTALLRNMNVPCKLVFGDRCGEYHSWALAYIGDEWIIADATNGFVGNSTDYLAQICY